ncbi:MAG: YbaK/EbsC family protein [Chloroflexota bacterium]
MAIAITLRDFLETSGVHYDLVEHPYSSTSMHAADEAHVSGENLAKGVVLQDGEHYLVAVIPATHMVQLGKLHKQFNRYFSLAEEKAIHDLFTDCSIGAVPPIGDAYGIEVIFDDRLNECSDVYFEAGDHTDLVHVSAADFKGLMGDARHGVISRHI